MTKDEILLAEKLIVDTRIVCSRPWNVQIPAQLP
jgi:hypothetical protein